MSRAYLGGVLQNHLLINRLHGFGGLSIVSEATDVSRNRIYRALLEMEEKKRKHSATKERRRAKKNNRS